MLEFLRVRWTSTDEEVDIMSDNKRGQEQGEEAAASPRTTFLALYRRHVNPTYSYIYSRAGNQADAEDLTEQVFTAALEGWERYEEQGQARAWLFTIAHGRLVDYYRIQREDLPFDEALDSPLDHLSPEAQVMHRERLDQLSRLVADLDEEQQELLQLRFVAELTYSEIGDVVGRSEGAVKIAIYRLLDRLRARWPVQDLLSGDKEEGESE